MKIAVHGREFPAESTPNVQQVFDELKNHNIDFKISDSFMQTLKVAGIETDQSATFHNHDDIDEADFMLSLGGDGTLLEAVGIVGKHETPILGINFGRLGFLASVQPENIKQALSQLTNGNFSLDSRTLLNATASFELFEKGTNFALNEVAISKTDTSSMIIIHAYINGEFLNSYWADGLMVATSTGSTGYSLSCGGPLVMPHSANFIITPICPHNLFVRPMVVSDSSTINLRVESRSKSFLLSMDSRAKIISNEEDLNIEIKKSDFNARLVTLEGGDFLNTLRQKLGWGKDVRNRIGSETSQSTSPQ
jgi:NAD+ kinase